MRFKPTTIDLICLVYHINGCEFVPYSCLIFMWTLHNYLYGMKYRLEKECLHFNASISLLKKFLMNLTRKIIKQNPVKLFFFLFRKKTFVSERLFLEEKLVCLFSSKNESSLKHEFFKIILTKKSYLIFLLRF